jgi:Sulfotransferase family
MNRAGVRIADYAEPKFTAEGRAIVDGIASLAGDVVLEPGALLRDACAQTGLDDFGDDDFLERLHVYADALEREAHLSATGRVMTYGMLLQLLKNRLLVEATVQRNPEVLDVDIAQPIIVAGMPRTGTTHLHNLMAADPALRSLPYWEALEPVLAPAEHPVAGSTTDPRRERTDLATSMINTVMPLFVRMHEMTTDHVHEEIQLLAIDLSTMLFETTALVPSWRDYYQAHDQTSSYRYLRKVLQVCQWQRGGVRWVLKSPQHLEQFRVLADVFPDATFVVTHRDPVAITASFVTMVTYSARMNAAHIDPHAYGSYWSARVEDLLRSCSDERDLLPADRTIDVQFRDFMRDDIATVQRIYDVAGQPFTDESRQHMRSFIAEHPRGKHGRVEYDLSDFGIDEQERRKALQFYVDRFGVEPETLNS